MAITCTREQSIAGLSRYRGPEKKGMAVIQMLPQFTWKTKDPTDKL